jgi:hypothetical protein
MLSVVCTRVAELLLRDLHRDAEITQKRRVYVAKVMPRHASASRAFGGRLQDVREQLRFLQPVALPIRNHPIGVRFIASGLTSPSGRTWREGPE